LPEAICAKGDRFSIQKKPLRVHSSAEAHPELDTLGKIAAALGVHPRELLED
jgi:hypothetical protein